MGWEDRHYYRDRPAGGEMAFQLSSFMRWSLPLGRMFGVNVRVHWFFLLMLALYLLIQGAPLWTLRWVTLLFGSVLLHEFGHVFACRRMGGHADEILLWPLGGLAYVSPPRTIRAEFWTVAWGPLVTIFIALGSFLALTLWLGDASPASPNPFRTWSGWLTLEGAMRFGSLSGVERATALVLLDLYVLNTWLAMFNLFLIFYPFDGGRLVQIAAWKVVGYGRSMYWASTVGLFGAGAVVLVGVVTWHLMLVFIGIFGGLTCYRTRMALKHDDGAEEEHYATAYAEPAARVRRKGALRRWRNQRVVRARRRAQEEEAQLQAEVDRILDKVKQHGLHSLAPHEKRTLQRATERQRRAG